MSSGVLDVVQLVTNAVIATLGRPVDQGGTGKQVGDHQAPKNPTFPYYVVYQLPGGTLWGAGLVDPEGAGSIRYLVRSVGKRRDQAQLAADAARRVLLGRDPGGAFLSSIPPPDGWVICGRLSADEAPPGVDPEGSPPEVFSVPEQYEISVTPQ